MPPYGWKRAGDDWVPVLEEQAVIRAVVRMRTEDPMMGYQAIADQLEEEGHRPRGRQWHSGTVRRIWTRWEKACQLS